jgi:hypothetical protein
MIADSKSAVLTTTLKEKSKQKTAEAEFHAEPSVDCGPSMCSQSKTTSEAVLVPSELRFIPPRAYITII